MDFTNNAVRRAVILLTVDSRLVRGGGGTRSDGERFKGGNGKVREGEGENEKRRETERKKEERDRERHTDLDRETHTQI